MLVSVMELPIAIALVSSGALAAWVAALRLRVRSLEERVAERSSKLHAFAVELIRGEEEQRTRIARELHDGLGQIMTAVNIELQVLKEAAPDGLKPRVDDVRALAAQVMAEMRRIAHDLRPPILDEMGLSEAVRALVSRMERHAGLTIDLEVGEAIDPLPSDTAIACYRLVQEALNNVVRHSGAGRARVRLFRREARVEVEIVDDGKGLDYDPHAKLDGHFGLYGLQERVGALGGTFSVGKNEGGGTRLAARLPV